MNRKLLLAGLAAITAASSAYAIPAFARQMNVSCTACHASNGYPTLTRFGRDFKASGYTMIGKENTIEDNNPRNKFLSLPQTLNVSMVAEPSMTKDSNANGTTVTTTDIGLFVGGRIGEHMGTFIEVGYDDGASTWSLANFVVPITYKSGDYTYGIVPYNTDGHGVTGGFELLNIRDGALAGIGAAGDDIGLAQGAAFYVYNENFNVNYTAWSKGNKSASGMRLASSVKAVYTPEIAGWDLAFGAQYMFGNTNDVNAAGDTAVAGTSLKARAFALDFQALGNVSSLPVVFDASYANAANDSDAFGGLQPNNKTAFVGDLSVGVIPRELVVLGNYTRTDDGSDTAGVDATNNAEMVGLRYFLMQNVYAQTDITFNSSNQEPNKSWGLSMVIGF